MALANVINDILPLLDMSSYCDYKSALENRIIRVSQHCKSGICFEHIKMFLLNERISKLYVLAVKDCGITSNSPYPKVPVLLTPPLSSGINSLLCSQCSQFLALISESCVYIVDAQFGPREFGQDQIVRAIYCAIDLRDIFCRSKCNDVIAKVRWHPKSSRTLVIVTENSFIYYVHCIKSSENQSIRFNLWLEADLSVFTHSALDATYQDMEESDEGSLNEDDADNSSLSNKKINLSFALGSKCVDFDFGSPLVASKRGLSEVQLQDCCLFLLYETGDVIQVYGCLSVRKVNQLKFNVLHILPPSLDNYGDEFCTILCIRPNDIQEVFSFEKPPDILVLADKTGRLHNGIVLRANLPGQNKNKSKIANPSVLLCLVDIVDLNLIPCNRTVCRHGKISSEHNDVQHYHSSDSMLNSSNYPGYDHWSPPSLSLEPADLNVLDNIEYNSSRSMDSTSFVKNRLFGLKYLHQGYYAIHPMGIHLVSLSWIENLSLWCSEFGDQLLGDYDKSTTVEAIRDWQSCVKHIVCGQITVSSPNRINDQEGKCRLAGFMELSSNIFLNNEPKFPTANKPVTPRSSKGVTLLFIRAPIQSVDSADNVTDHSYLVQLVNLTQKPVIHVMKQQRYVGSDSETTNQYDSCDSTLRSHFTSQIKQILSEDDSQFPVITALNLQPNLTQQQLVQFFIKVSDALRKGPLDRLMKARSIIEHYCTRLQGIISTQYSEAMKLTSERQTLQSKAEELAKRQSIITERQIMLDKRMANLTSRLAALGDGPTRAEIAMRSEVVVIRDRLHKGLRQWLSNLQNRRDKLEKQILLRKKTDKSSIRNPLPNVLSKTVENIEEDQWQTISEELRKETLEIKMLINAVKTLNTSVTGPT
ncbi:hypothetical protein MN116_004686 [Schistosoma mekongi]|uniref:Nuclear pore complex protein Nup88 n=1 Tax=Schistosoma mekongi TaxID=38744 RepID=A0AAE1ZCE3_SCHME|nr:hypothetical protein MN116_004686 [Schistosoma mekongi]